MPCQVKIVTYYNVRGNARFDLCVEGTAAWAGLATVIDSDLATPHIQLDAARLGQPCGDPAGAHLVVGSGQAYSVEIELAVVTAGTLKICHSVTFNGQKHAKSCCWELQVAKGDTVSRRVVLLVP